MPISKLKKGDILEEKYEILKELGRGGMAVVYLAENTILKKLWAIKEVNITGANEARAHRLIEEAEMMKQLDHNAFATIVDIIYIEDFVYIVMEYVEGKPLQDIIRPNPKDRKHVYPQTESDVFAWAKQLCEALIYLHGKNPPIVYRDMKPSNVMLKPDGTIKIIDFGIAKEYIAGQKDAVAYTKGFAPPEQYEGLSEPRSDIYALGMTMHYLLIGVHPSQQEYLPVRAYNNRLSEGVEAIIDKCVQPSPEARYQNCEELLYDLEHPEIVTKEYKAKQKKLLRKFNCLLTLTFISLIIGIGTHCYANDIQSNTYESLISVVSSTPLEEKMEKYKEAIKIYPDEVTAYQLVLEAFESEGRFDKEESNQFLALYNAHKDDFDQTSKEFAELNYRIGMMYFNYYTSNGNVSFAERIQKAYSFFEQNHKDEISSEFIQKRLSDCYYQTCSFFKQYVLNSAIVEEASKENYNELFTVISQALRDVKEIEGASTYDQLSLYNGVFLLLYDQRYNMVSIAMEQDKILSLLDQVYNSAKSLTVQKEQSKRLQQQIIDNYQGYRKAIIRAYTNTQERR